MFQSVFTVPTLIRESLSYKDSRQDALFYRTIASTVSTVIGSSSDTILRLRDYDSYFPQWKIYILYYYIIL